MLSLPSDSLVLFVIDEEFVPDPAAKASILSNRGLSHSALRANGKLSLAQRVPMKDAQKPFAACSSSRVSRMLGFCTPSFPCLKVPWRGDEKVLLGTDRTQE